MVAPCCQLRQLNYAITPLGAELAVLIMVCTLSVKDELIAPSTNYYDATANYSQLLPIDFYKIRLR